jgi:hypothetical protein
MRFAAAAASAFASMAYTASAFGVRSQVATRAFVSSSRLNANVLKLSEPQSQLLDQVDVFIFDCDGVIWRVSLFWYHITVFHRYVDFITT